MKTIAPAAMEAIERGEAIVTGAVEIIPGATVSRVFSTVDVVDLDSITNAAVDATGGLISGITVSGFDASDLVRVTLPTGQTYVAFSPWGIPAKTVAFTGSFSWFNVIPDGDAGAMFQLGARHPEPSYDGYEAARAAFGSRLFTGYSAYTFYIEDNPIIDNSGGLSIMVERGVIQVTESATPPIRVWGGYGPIEIAGEIYEGIGDRGLAQQTAGAVGGVAQGLVLTLSGIEPEVLALLDADEIKGASVVLRRLIFGPDGKTLLDAHVFDRGRIDTVESDETIGGTAAIKVAVESAARGLGRSGARQRSDSDQRLINPNDGYFRNTAYAAEKMLYWGGKKPHRVGSVGGIGSSSGFSSGSSSV